MKEDITITVHKDERPPLMPPVHWRPAEALRPDGYQGVPMRTCSFCGSGHPADVVRALAAGAKFCAADWKYGWPHKFYLDGIQNPIAGQQIIVGSKSNGRNVEYIRGRALPKTHGKWYNIHLRDLDAEDFAELAGLIRSMTGIQFDRQENGIKYVAVGHGRQI